MKNQKERQFRREIRLRIGKILDSFRENGVLSQEKEKELHYLRSLLEEERIPEEVGLPFAFNLDNFTLEDYSMLREKGYTVDQIQAMCGFRRKRFDDWRKEHNVYGKNCC
ncbi:hypothetical protein [Enterococcus faecium]